MHNFIPIPHKSSDEWASDEVINIVAPNSSQEILIIAIAGLAMDILKVNPVRCLIQSYSTMLRIVYFGFDGGYYLLLS